MLGKIEQISVRSYWKNEEHDFTPWLAKEENIQILSDEIGIDLEVENTEVFIGSYKADIVARDADGNAVIIENQLEKTDHKHLGQKKRDTHWLANPNHWSIFLRPNFWEIAMTSPRPTLIDLDNTVLPLHSPLCTENIFMWR